MTTFKNHLYFLTDSSQISVMNLKTMNNQTNLEIFKKGDESYHFDNLFSVDDKYLACINDNYLFVLD